MVYIKFRAISKYITNIDSHQKIVVVRVEVNEHFVEEEGYLARLSFGAYRDTSSGWNQFTGMYF